MIEDSISRNDLYKKWFTAMKDEIPLLVKQSTIYGELKPEIKYVEMMQTEGGFIAGRFEIVFIVRII